MLEEAIQAIKSGDKQKGKRLLVKILRQDSRNEMAWLWLSAVVDSNERSNYCLKRVLALNPNNQSAQMGLIHLGKDQYRLKPTAEKPLLIGLLVDVSLSMSDSIQNRRGRTLNRLRSFQESLDDLIVRAKELSREGSSEKVAPLVKLFAYGFGFGGLSSLFFGGNGPSVRDLLLISEKTSSTVTIDKLANNWSHFRKHFELMSKQMFGTTPMKEAFQIVQKRLRQERKNNKYTGQPVLFVLSDGEPDNPNITAHIIRDIAEQLKSDEILIISCYVTGEDFIESRRLYGSSLEKWPFGAQLMFDCASEVPINSPFHSYLLEYNWIIEPHARLFTQINQSEILSEFMNLVLSPLVKDEPLLLKSLDETKSYHLSNIRLLLTEGFTDEELRRLCYDIPSFRSVYNQLAQNTGKSQIVDLLIEHANRKLQLDVLLALAKEYNPDRYQKHQPYYEIII